MLNGPQILLYIIYYISKCILRTVLLSTWNIHFSFCTHIFESWLYFKIEMVFNKHCHKKVTFETDIRVMLHVVALEWKGSNWQNLLKCDIIYLVFSVLSTIWA